MALVLNKWTQYGVPAKYWKVSVTNIDWSKQVANITLIGYISKEARFSGLQAIDSVEFYWANTDFTFTAEDNIVEDSYIKIKTIGEWTAATDDI